MVGTIKYKNLGGNKKKKVRTYESNFSDPIAMKDETVEKLLPKLYVLEDLMKEKKYEIKSHDELAKKLTGVNNAAEKEIAPPSGIDESFLKEGSGEVEEAKDLLKEDRDNIKAPPENNSRESEDFEVDDLFSGEQPKEETKTKEKKSDDLDVDSLFG